MPHLIVSVSANPPKVKLMGTTIRDETIQRLEAILPDTTTTAVANANRDPPKFNLMPNPPHWHMDLGQHYVDHLGRSHIFLKLIESLAGEDWRLKGTNTVINMDNGQDVTKFFFFRP